MAAFHNPVRVTFADAVGPVLGPMLRGRRCWVVTTRGACARPAFAEVRAAAGSLFAGATTSVTPNPTVDSIAAEAPAVAAGAPEVIVALGGGSAIDAAKGLAAVTRVADAAGWLSRHVSESAPYPDGFSPVPLIAIPTTAGTGSEVTMWGTLWSPSNWRKHSVSHPALYPEHAVIVPALTHSLGYVDSLIPALDALSHSMEAIWNPNANPVSDGLATDAIRTIAGILEHRYAERYAEPSVRTSVQQASVKAGLAFSATRTAIAHSISYPLTVALGVPHGLACSFTLAEILRLNGSGGRAEPVVAALDRCDTASAIDRLYGIYRATGVPDELRRYIDWPSRAVDLDAEFITPGRADNSLIPVSQEGARGIVASALAALGV
jgi:alcohol dehydrogenase